VFHLTHFCKKARKTCEEIVVFHCSKGPTAVNSFPRGVPKPILFWRKFKKST